MDVLIRMKGVAQIGFALGFGLYMAAHLFGAVAMRAGLQTPNATEPASTVPVQGLLGRDPAFTMTRAGETLGWAAPRRQLRVITRTC